MKVEYKDYKIEFLNEKNYSTKSVDNIREYKFEYSKGKENNEKFYPNSKHGIRINDILTNELISSVIICEYGGATTIHEKSFFIDNQRIWICVCDKIYCLNLPKLDIEWYGRFDYATNLSINRFNDDFIIHGELEILRINRKGDIKWRFGARDIFISESGEKNFEITNDRIEVQDWVGNKYMIDENGYEII